MITLSNDTLKQWAKNDPADEHDGHTLMAREIIALRAELVEWVVDSAAEHARPVSDAVDALREIETKHGITGLVELAERSER